MEDKLVELGKVVEGARELRDFEKARGIIKEIQAIVGSKEYELIQNLPEVDRVSILTSRSFPNRYILAFTFVSSYYKGVSGSTIKKFCFIEDAIRYVFDEVNSKGIVLDCSCDDEKCDDDCKNNDLRPFLRRDKYDFKIKDEFRNNRKVIDDVLWSIEFFEHNEGLTTKFFYSIEEI